MLHPEVRMVQPQMPTLVGHEAFRRGFVEPLFAMIPDLHGTVAGWAADGDVIFIDLVLEGTVGGRPVRMETVDRITLRDGLAVERVAFMDPSPLLKAVATRPKAWPRFARAQARQIQALIKNRRNR
jgi:ketosteroid isomerase-like protein